MATVYEVPADKLIDKAAKDLKDTQKFARPEWVLYVKTGTNVERQPDNPDWWWVRAASVLRKVYIDGPVGIRRLRTAYGGRKHRGVKPEEFRRAGGKHLRVILQESDRLGLTEKVKGGRKMTAKGQSYFDKLANELLKQ